MHRTFARGAVIGLLLALPGAAPQAQAPAPSGANAPAAATGNAENGKKLYEAVGCWQCHGYSAQGGGGPRIGPTPMPLPAFTRYIRMPTRSMPPYTAKVLKDSELADIHEYLKTVPKPLDPASIPLLKS